jgi:hypothetical protein
MNHLYLLKKANGLIFQGNYQKAERFSTNKVYICKFLNSGHHTFNGLRLVN